MKNVANSSSCVKGLLPCLAVEKPGSGLTWQVSRPEVTICPPALFQHGEHRISPKIVSKAPVLVRGMGSLSERHPAMPGRLHTMDRPHLSPAPVITPTVKNYFFLARASL